MEEWDQETLEKVVESKKNEYNQNKPTDIVWFIRFIGVMLHCLLDFIHFHFLWLIWGFFLIFDFCVLFESYFHSCLFKWK